MDKFLFLHVPHTGGRAISRYCFFNSISNYLGKVHNDQITDIDLSGSQIASCKIYFILRNPTERLFAEYLHYSKSLTVNFQVNDINQELFPSNNNSFASYCALERVRNRYTKFLLLVIKPNYKFTQEITNDLFNEVMQYLSEYLSSDKILFDLFEDQVRTKFISLCSEETNTKSLEDIRKMYPSTNKSEMDFIELATTANHFDLLLYEKLTNNTARM